MATGKALVPLASIVVIFAVLAMAVLTEAYSPWPAPSPAPAPHSASAAISPHLVMSTLFACLAFLSPFLLALFH
ncbi:hypothetical protein RHGRI_028143 [Rhododendron griersonianum]|uniref:Uncharacterized protein n=1 Tax=Rhododendron griersonianum TaxID=479676 RepID=A0AAV6IER4_9ERIC|nr:hypothetical protein RHGRI_028143 [Rhododendron griersonianum]